MAIFIVEIDDESGEAVNVKQLDENQGQELSLALSPNKFGAAIRSKVFTNNVNSGVNKLSSSIRGMAQGREATLLRGKRVLKVAGAKFARSTVGKVAKFGAIGAGIAGAGLIGGAIARRMRNPLTADAVSRR
jgi:hypothetical protein